MSIDSIGGYSSSPTQAYGNDLSSQYQSSTAADSMNSAPMDKQTFGAAVVSKTLDYMNSGSGSSGSLNSDYDFQKSVLGSYASGIGKLVDDTV